MVKTSFSLQSIIYLTLSCGIEVLYLFKILEEPIIVLLVTIIVLFVVWNYPIYKVTDKEFIEERFLGLYTAKRISLSDITSINNSMVLDNRKKKKYNNYSVFCGQDEVMYISPYKYKNFDQFIEEARQRINK